MVLYHANAEVKCPFCKKHDFTFNATDDQKFCLEQDGTSITLQSSHPYFYQVQAHIMVCKKQYCDFFLWTEKDYNLESVLMLNSGRNAWRKQLPFFNLHSPRADRKVL